MGQSPANRRDPEQTAGESSWRAIVRVLRSPVQLTGDVIATLFPADCRHCEGPREGLSRLPLCAACAGRIHKSDLFACTVCGEAMDLDLDFEDMRFTGMLAQGFRCRECTLAPPPFTRAVSYAVYDDEIRTLIHLLKYEGVRHAAKLLAPPLGETILQLEPDARTNLLVVAVPLHPARERQRGYNQSVLLADAALAWLRRTRPNWLITPAHHALRRIKSTESQYVLSARGRRRNLRGAFAVAADVTGREILLVDDILTSGATARECARVLLAAGAAKVWVATVARAQKRFVQKQQQDAGELVASWDLAAGISPPGT